MTSPRRYPFLPRRVPAAVRHAGPQLFAQAASASARCGVGRRGALLQPASRRCACHCPPLWAPLSRSRSLTCSHHRQDTCYSPDQHFLIYSSWSQYIHLITLDGDRHEALDLTPEGRGHICPFSIRFSEVGSGGAQGAPWLLSLARLSLTFCSRSPRNLCPGLARDRVRPQHQRGVRLRLHRRQGRLPPMGPGQRLPFGPARAHAAHPCLPPCPPASAWLPFGRMTTMSTPLPFLTSPPTFLRAARTTTSARWASRVARESKSQRVKAMRLAIFLHRMPHVPLPPGVGPPDASRGQPAACGCDARARGRHYVH